MKKIIFTSLLMLYLVYLMTAGLALAENNAPQFQDMPATSERLYGIGSVSKVFAATAVMKLVDEEKLSLDTPIVAYIPDFVMADERYRKITPRMLLNHSSGLMGMTGENMFLLGDNDTTGHDHFLELLKTQTLKHDPGDRSIYSNDSFMLAEILVERVSGKTFTGFIEQAFSAPLGLTSIKTPQSEFDHDHLATTYLGNSELKPETLGMIGSGGLYATMEDLCRFAEIFMDSADGSVLSKEAVEEMAKNQHEMEIAGPDTDNMFRYGLGWDCVEQYPFNRFGIRALSKGGDTEKYHANLTVLPEYNLAAAVASSGEGGLEAVIAQQIILAVLEEEGLIPQRTALSLPQQNLSPAQVPQSLKARAGIYDMGMYGMCSVAISDDALTLTRIGVLNERPMVFLYNTDGEFVSTNGDFLGVHTMVSGVLGVTAIHFQDEYLTIQTYADIPELGQSAEAMPIAKRIEANPVPQTAQDAWAARSGKEYLLVSEKHTSAMYLSMPLAKITTDERVPGYILQGVYQGSGKPFPATRIVGENNTKGYQNIPTMMGRDIVNLGAVTQNGTESLCINNARYIDAAAAVPYSKLGETVVIGAEPVWVDIDGGQGGKTICIISSDNGAWFVYDDKMNCTATSLVKRPQETVILPESGRLAFAGEPGARVTVR